MDVVSTLVAVVIIIILIQLVRLFFADGDLTLMWKETFGKRPQGMTWIELNIFFFQYKSTLNNHYTYMC